jgi:hypothetical protein
MLTVIDELVRDVGYLEDRLARRNGEWRIAVRPLTLDVPGWPWPAGRPRVSSWGQEFCRRIPYIRS